MRKNSEVIKRRIRLAMKNQSAIEGKRVTEDEVIVLAMHDYIRKQEKILIQPSANLGN